MKHTIIAAVLSVISVSAFATEGHVDSNSLVCGDHFVTMTAVDKTITEISVDDVRSIFATLEHNVVKGSPSILTHAVMKDTGSKVTGYTFVITPTTATMYEANFLREDDSPIGMVSKLGEKLGDCR